MSDELSVKDIFVRFESDIQQRTIDISVGDIVPIYEDDNSQVEDANIVGLLVNQLVYICEDEDLGSLKFCEDARNELRNILSNVEESAKRMRMMVNYSEGRSRAYRVHRAARERSAIIHFLNLGVEDLSEVINERSFYEGGY